MERKKSFEVYLKKVSDIRKRIKYRNQIFDSYFNDTLDDLFNNVLTGLILYLFITIVCFIM